MRPIPRRRAASNTLTVPTTFTCAPATGSALQKGTCRAARWITAQGRTASKIRTTVLLSEMSPVRHRIFSRSLSAMSRRGRRLSSDKSSAHAGTPARALDLSEDKRRPRLLIAESDLEKIRWRTGDISESKTVVRIFEAVRPCAVIHLAALQVPFCKADPVAGAQVN